MNWSAVIAGINSLGLECLLKGTITDAPTEWTTFLIEPVAGYVESTCGPIRHSEIEWIIIKPVRSIKRGRLVQPILKDMSEELITLLKACGASYSINEQGMVVYGRES